MIERSSVRKTYVLTGLLFCLIPVIALAMSAYLYGEPPESPIVFTYIPLFIGLFAGLYSGSIILGLAIVALGAAITFGIWFCIGLGATWLSRKISKRWPLAMTAVLFSITILVGIIWPWQYSIWKEAMDASTAKRHAEIEQRIEANDPGITPEFCNDVDGYWPGMACWENIAKRPESLPDICDKTVFPHDRSRCLYAMALKLDKPELCQYSPDYWDNDCRYWYCDALPTVEKKACFQSFEQDIIRQDGNCEDLGGSDFFQSCTEAIKKARLEAESAQSTSASSVQTSGGAIRQGR